MQSKVCILLTFGLVALVLAACTGPPQATEQEATTGKGSTGNAGDASQARLQQPEEAKKDASFNCPVSPITTDRPKNDNTAAWSATWYRSPDGEIWASEPGLRKLREGGDKVLWVKPLGEKLTITGKRLDGDAPPLKATAPDGYEMFDYQASGITFPTGGCWEIEATEGKTNWRFVVNIAGSE
jgi:hypothetical protein